MIYLLLIRSETSLEWQQHRIKLGSELKDHDPLWKNLHSSWNKKAFVSEWLWWLFIITWRTLKYKVPPPWSKCQRVFDPSWDLVFFFFLNPLTRFWWVAGVRNRCTTRTHLWIGDEFVIYVITCCSKLGTINSGGLLQKGVSAVKGRSAGGGQRPSRTGERRALQVEATTEITETADELSGVKWGTNGQHTPKTQLSALWLWHKTEVRPNQSTLLHSR